MAVRRKAILLQSAGNLMTETTPPALRLPISIDHSRRWRLLPAMEIVVLAIGALLPFVLADYLTIYATRVLILCLFALSFDLVWGYAGIMSFGQAVFFGSAGYGVALIARDIGVTSMLIVLPAGILIGFTFALLLGGFLLLAIAGWVLGRWPAKGFASAIAAAVGLLAIALPIYAAQEYGNVTAAVANARAVKGALSWEPFTPQLVEAYRAQGKPVFVDFTASWCLSCQVNERVVLNREDVQKRLRDSGIALVRADWTRHDEVIAQTLASLGRSGVPTYVLYSGTAGEAPQILPEVLTTGIIFDALDGLKQTKQAGVSQAKARAGLQ